MTSISKIKSKSSNKNSNTIEDDLTNKTNKMLSKVSSIFQPAKITNKKSSNNEFFRRS